METVKIEKLDNQGRGICFINNTITFVPNTLPNEEVVVELTKISKKYNEAKVLEYITKSPNRIENKCPFFGLCGGCELLHSTYENTLKYKKEKLESIIYKYAHIYVEFVLYIVVHLTTLDPISLGAILYLILC